jgi:hypothetical protein
VLVVTAHDTFADRVADKWQCRGGVDKVRGLRLHPFQYRSEVEISTSDRYEILD